MFLQSILLNSVVYTRVYTDGCYLLFYMDELINVDAFFISSDEKHYQQL